MLFDPLDLNTYNLQYVAGSDKVDYKTIPAASSVPVNTIVISSGVPMITDGTRWSRVSKYGPSWNNILGALGDSRTANAGKDGTSENIGPLHWACMLSGQRLSFYTSYNFGVGGYSTQDIIDNTLDSACRSLPSSFFVLCGTNDRTTMTAAQSIANIEYIVTSLVNSGKDVYIMAELPRGDVSMSPTYRFTSDQLTAHLQVRNYILSMRGRNGVFVCDAWQDMCIPSSTTGDIKTGYSIDGLHPNTTGAYYVAQSIAKQIIANHPVAPSIVPVENSTSSGWLNTNQMLDGTGGTTFGTGGSGSLATGWRGSTGSTVGGITRVYSKTAEGYQQIVIGGTAASGSNPQMDLLSQVSLQSTCAGSTVQAFSEMSIASGSSGIISLQLGIMVVSPTTGTNYVWDGDYYTAASPLPSVGYSGVFKTQPIAVPSDATDVRLLIRSYGTTSATASGTIIVKSAGMKIVS